MSTENQNYGQPPQPQHQPQVAVVGINPGTAGCLSILFAVIGLPVFAYIQPGKILRGIVMQVIYWVLMGLAVLIPMIVGGSIGMAAEQAGDQDTEMAAAGGMFLGMFLFPGLVWFLWIIVTAIDINKCVKDHNSGRGVSYT